MTNTESPNTTPVDTRNLIDNESGCTIGAATADQIEASDEARDGIIAIDSDGEVVHQPGKDERRVWVEA